MRLVFFSPAAKPTYRSPRLRNTLQHFVKLKFLKPIVATIFFIILFTGAHSISQNQVDSLRNIWSSKSLPDTVRMQAIYDMAIDGYLYSQPDSAHYFAGELLAMAESINDMAFVADARSLIGSAQYLTGRFTESLESFKEYKRISEENGLNERLIKANINIATVLLQTSQFDEALSLFYESYELLEASEDSILAAQCLNNIGLVYMSTNRYSEALKYFRRSLRVFINAVKPALINYARGNIAYIYSYQGKIDSALIEFYEILEIRKDLNDLYGMVTTHNNIAANLMLQGHVARALDHYQETVAISEQINDKDGMALAMTQIASTYIQIGELDSASTYYQYALDLRREMQTLPGITTLLLKLANIEIDKSHYEKATSYLEESKELCIQVKDSAKLSDVMVSEARINTKTGNYNAALEQLLNAAEIQRSFSDSVRLATTFHNLGELQMKRNNISAAKPYAELALNISQKYGGIEHKRNAHNLMYKVLKASGHPDKALSHLEAYVSLRDSLHNDENRNTLMRYRLQFEFEKKELKLQASRAEKDAQTAIQVERQQRTIYALSGGALLLLVAGGGSFFLYRQRQRNKALADSIASRDFERNRLSRELHDGVASELYGIQMAIDSGQYAYDATSLNRELSRIRDDVRHISHDLAMPDIQHTSLPEMARYLVDRWRHVGRKVSILIEPQDNATWQISPEKALHLYRIMQEGLTNALRYSKEDRDVQVELIQVKGQIKLEIINHYIETLVGGNTAGIGLKNLQERAQLIGGSATITMDDGQAKLLIIIPVI